MCVETSFIAMDEGERLEITRNILNKDLLRNKAELENLIEISDFINAEIKADMMNGMILEIEEINDMMCRKVKNENELTHELQMKSEVLKLRCEVASKLKQISVSTQSAQRTNTSSSTEESSREYSGGARCKLPQLVLPKFDGDYSSWHGWYDQFSSAIGNNNRLAPVDKFNYLLTFLEGRAKETVSGINISAANYQVAIDLLKKRYSKPRLLVKSLLCKILPPVEVANSFESLKDLYAKFEITARNIENFRDVGLDQKSISLIFSVLMQFRFFGI